MTRIADRTVLFADLRGSTALFEKLGNAEATTLVTQVVQALAVVVRGCQGQVVKTLGDGLMAMFETSQAAVEAAERMHEALDERIQQAAAHPASAVMRALRVQVGVARGEVVELRGDCFGDAVNVAARLIDHAGDNETLVTGEVLQALSADWRGNFRDLDRLVLRGRAERVQVHVMGGRRGGLGEAPVTQFSGDFGRAVLEPDGLRLSWSGRTREFASHQTPVVLGRSSQVSFCVDDSRVSRSHARVDWHSGGFQITDLSYNGTYVRFADTEIVSLRRGSCTLHGSGTIGLGGPPSDDVPASCVGFEVLRLPQQVATPRRRVPR